MSESLKEFSKKLILLAHATKSYTGNYIVNKLPYNIDTDKLLDLVMQAYNNAELQNVLNQITKIMGKEGMKNEN
jgi:hypothetical protein